MSKPTTVPLFALATVKNTNDTPYNVRFYSGRPEKTLCGLYHQEWEVSHMEFVTIKQVGVKIEDAIKRSNMYYIAPQLHNGDTLPFVTPAVNAIDFRRALDNGGAVTITDLDDMRSMEIDPTLLLLNVTRDFGVLPL
jgi:hypothetical protein